MALNRTNTSRPAGVRPPLPDPMPYVPSLENLDEITAWLGTFRERLRIAHPKDQPKLDATMKELDTHSGAGGPSSPNAGGRLLIQPSHFRAVELLKGA